MSFKFNKKYFEADNSGCLTCKNMEMVRTVYFPLSINREKIKPYARVLDVGCAFGYFLKCCDEHNFKTYGTDISEYAITEAKKITKAELFTHDLNNGLHFFKDNFFDVITAFDVIEHLISPYNILKEFNRILGRNGKLIITTPNISSLGQIIRGNDWHGFKDRTHLYLFTPVSLKYLVIQAGFKVTRLTTPFHPLPGMVQKLVNRTCLGGQIWLVGEK